MPITQDRMIRLVNAAKDYMAALEDSGKLIENAIMLVNRGEQSAAEALETLQTLAKPLGLLNDPIHSYNTIMMEGRHFQKFAARNNREQRRLALRRAEGSGSPNPTAPRALQVAPVNSKSLLNTLDEAMDFDPVGLIGAGASLAEDRRSELDREVEEALKKMASE